MLSIMTTDKAVIKNREKSAKWRKENRDKYNAYMADYMNKRNARIRNEGTPEEKAKARQQNTDKCRRQRHKKRAAKIAREAEETRRLIISEGSNPGQLQNLH